MYQKVFSIVWSSPETNVISFPVLVRASDFCDNLRTFEYKTEATHLLISTATSLECRTNIFLLIIDRNMIIKNNIDLQTPWTSLALSSLIHSIISKELMYIETSIISCKKAITRT